jgi:hypothetical protein
VFVVGRGACVGEGGSAGDWVATGGRGVAIRDQGTRIHVSRKGRVAYNVCRSLR